MERPAALCTLLLSVLSLLLAAGCAAPEARIKRHAELFGMLPPEAQQDVRDGVIRLGHTTDTVFLAVGRPRYVQARVEQNGTTTIWRYTAYRWRARAHHWPRRHGRWWHGRWWHGPPYLDDSEEYDVLRVEFRDAKVVAIEHIER